MKKYLFLVKLSFAICNHSAGQVTCIFCFEQNAPVSSAVNNFILNGGFENGCSAGGIFCPNIYHTCDITNWICTGGSMTYSCICDAGFSVIVEGNKAAYFGNSAGYACSSVFGDTSCLGNIACTVSGIPSGYPVSGPAYGGATGVSLEQTVTGLITGNIYVLEFWAGGESSFGGRGLFAADVGFGNIILRNNPTNPGNSIGTRFIIEFVATSSSHTIKFTNWGHICGGGVCTELILDDVRLFTLAELSGSIVPPCLTGTNELNESVSVVVYPNPVSNELTVKKNSSERAEIILYDIMSRKLLRQSFTNSASINTVQLTKGIYLYEVRNKNGIIRNGKVIKQ
jgi:hypothetical protein